MNKEVFPLTEYFEQELRRSFDAGSGFTPHIDLDKRLEELRKLLSLSKSYESGSRAKHRQAINSGLGIATPVLGGVAKDLSDIRDVVVRLEERCLYLAASSLPYSSRDSVPCIQQLILPTISAVSKIQRLPDTVPRPAPGPVDSHE